jgi:Kinesin motor domain
MEGYGTDKGVSPRAVAELFSIVDSSKKDISYTLTFSMLEIYNESILDLLDNSPNKVCYVSVCAVLVCVCVMCPCVLCWCVYV